MNNRNTLIIIIILFFQWKAVSQKNLVPVQVFMNNGEKLQGQINFKDWDIIPKTINLIGENHKELNPLNTEKIEFQGSSPQIFIGKTISVAQFNNSLSRLSPTLELKNKMDTIFLRAIVIGTLSLYQHKDVLGTDHYFIAKNGAWDELLYHKYYRDQASKSIMQSFKYKGQLISKMDGCEHLHSKISLLDFNINKIKELIIEYNNCTENGFIEFTEKKEKRKLKFGLKAGLGLSHLSPKGDLKGLNFSYGLSPRFGIVGSSALARNLNKNIIQFELLYSSFKSKSDDDEYILNNDFLNIHLLYKYNLLNSDVKPYLQIGYKTNYIFKDRGTKRVNSFPKFSQGMLIGMGISRKNIELDLRYFVDNIASFSPLEDFFISTISLTATVYLF